MGINTYILTLNKNPILMHFLEEFLEEFLMIKNCYRSKLFKKPFFIHTHF